MNKQNLYKNLYIKNIYNRRINIWMDPMIQGGDDKHPMGGGSNLLVAKGVLKKGETSGKSGECCVD